MLMEWYTLLNSGGWKSLLSLFPFATARLTGFIPIAGGPGQVEQTSTSQLSRPQHDDLLQPPVFPSQFGCLSLQVVDLTRQARDCSLHVQQPLLLLGPESGWEAVSADA